MEKHEQLIVSGRLPESLGEMRCTAARLSSSREDLEALSRLMYLTGQFGSPSDLRALSRAFLDGATSRDRDRELVRSMGRAIELRAVFKYGDHAAVVRMSRDIDWQLLRNVPLVHFARCGALLELGDRTAALRALATIRCRTSDVAARVQKCHFHAMIALRGGDASGAAAAIRKLGPLSTSLDAESLDTGESLVVQVVRLGALLTRAIIGQRRGDDRQVVRDCQAFRGATLSQHFSGARQTAAELQSQASWNLGHREACLGVITSEPLPTLTSSNWSPESWAKRTAARARHLVCIDEPELAARELKKSDDVNRTQPSTRTAAFNLHTRGKIHVSRGTRGATGRALRCFREAEELFREQGDLSRNLLSYVLVDRAEIHVHRGDVAEALDCLRETLEIVHDLNDLQTKAKCILVKSYLLLERRYDLSKEDLYEEVLRELGVVHSPMLLFEILANLYMFSWDLGERLDITDNHFSQIERLREVLDADVFEQMYRKYVVHRVARRTMRHLFGCDPESLFED